MGYSVFKKIKDAFTFANNSVFNFIFRSIFISPKIKYEIDFFLPDKHQANEMPAIIVKECTMNLV